jgi:HEAT repeat protein
MTARYCPHCWKEVPSDGSICEHCGAPLNQEDEDYLAKLIAALWHPDYLTRRRAAFVMGRLRDGRARQPLMATLRREADPYVRAEAAAALGAFDDLAAEAALYAAELNGAGRPR